MVRKVRSHLEDPAADISRLAPRHLTKQEFGRRLYTAMVEKGWNQSELARRAELTRDSVSTYVRGASLPTPQSLKKLAEALGTTPEALLPNYVEGAIDAANPSFEMKVSPSRPTEAWLRVDQAVTTETALEIAKLLNADTLARGEK